MSAVIRNGDKGIPVRYLHPDSWRNAYGTNNGLSVFIWLRKPGLTIEQVDKKSWTVGDDLHEDMKKHAESVVAKDMGMEDGEDAHEWLKVAGESPPCIKYDYLPTKLISRLIDREAVCTVEKFPGSGKEASRETDWSTWKSTLTKNELTGELFMSFRSYKHLADWAKMMQRSDNGNDKTNLNDFDFAYVKIARTFEEGYILVNFEETVENKKRSYGVMEFQHPSQYPMFK